MNMNTKTTFLDIVGICTARPSCLLVAKKAIAPPPPQKNCPFYTPIPIPVNRRSDVPK